MRVGIVARYSLTRLRFKLILHTKWRSPIRYEAYSAAVAYLLRLSIRSHTRRSVLR